MRFFAAASDNTSIPTRGGGASLWGEPPTSPLSQDLHVGMVVGVASLAPALVGRTRRECRGRYMISHIGVKLCVTCFKNFL